MPGTEFFGEEEKKEINDVLSTGIFFRYNHDEPRKNIWKAKSFEEEVKKYTNAKYSLAVSSGSTAVHCVLAAAGIGYGDEVIVPPFTYVASIEAVLLAGAIPIFTDIDESLCLTAKSIEKVITPNTKAVLLVHMCGAAADLDDIVSLCDKKNIKLIEDAGQALGAFYKGKSVGLFGKAGAFSFDFFKITTAAEGGVLITNNKDLYNKADNFSDHGHDHIGNNRGMEQHPYIGFNYRISELHAAIGLAQMKKLKSIRKAKKNNKALLKSIIEKISEVSFRRMEDDEGDSGTFLNVLLPTQNIAEKVVNLMAKKGVQGCNYWFTNQFHFINQWDHIKNLKSISPIPAQHLELPQNYNNLKLEKSQDIIGRLISIGIKGKWNEKNVHDFGRVFCESVVGSL